MAVKYKGGIKRKPGPKSKEYLPYTKTRGKSRKQLNKKVRIANAKQRTRMK